MMISSKSTTSEVTKRNPETADEPLWSGFHQSTLAFPTRPALEVGGHTYTYEELHNKAASFAATLARYSPSENPRLTAVFAYRSATAFASVLGALLRGHGYVPLNPTFPLERTRIMFERSGCRSVIIDAQSEPEMVKVLAETRDPLLLLFPDRENVADLAARWPQHTVLGASDLEGPSLWSPSEGSPDSIAYLLFTSGSTGTPKGVMVSNRNVRSYVNWTVKRYLITEQDRLSQTFDMTFDLSAHDMFIAWERGACLCCPSQKQLIKPGAFINDSRLTIWFSVPSTAVFMRRLGQLKPGMYQGLRLSLFCGEALPLETANHWAMAAPNSIIENIYGPTELTIACTAYRWEGQRSADECEQGVVPIGEPFKGMKALVVDNELHEVEAGLDGELLMTGPQLCLGYWQDTEKTKHAFVIPPGQDHIYYRTGDRVRKPAFGKPMVYLGRIDNQVKILGHRVELGEIEAVIRQTAGVEGVVAIGWPVTPSGAEGLEVFLQIDSINTKALHESLRSSLPSYMLPRAIHCVSRFPLNANGKYDRKGLTKMLQDMK